ncbi:MAG TPA: FAD:protein FMN transferase, partial [Tepidisphaeraceae bacterium]|nr:FAD:protein FMN transferase [Tepidisphaeraceae bacterium]
MIAAAPSLIAQVTDRVRTSACCQTQGHRWYVSCQAMNTSIRIVFFTSFPVLARDFERAAIDWIGRFEARYSRFLPDSIVGRINATAGGKWLEIDEEAETIFAVCDRMHAATSGVFDPASLPLLRIWNWKADPPVLPNESQIREALRLSGWKSVQRRPRAIRLPEVGMGIDLGGIGKEFAADHLVHMARDRGIDGVMVDIGGDLRVAGRPPFKDGWYIGLEEPGKAGECWTALHLSDCAIATSGDYLRSFTHDGRRFGHILDPRTGRPVNNGCQAV